MRSHVLLFITLAALVGSPAWAGGGSALDLHVLVTNDDGFDSDGIMAVRDALLDAGHRVTLVGPAEQQSGKGGSINTGVLDFTPGEGTRVLTNFGDGIYSFDGSPSDTVGAALDVLLADDPPDLIVSGLNEGQNLAKPGTAASGTIGAALRATFEGLPAIAGSMEILFSEASDDFPSTVASYEPAAEFIARLIDRLTEANGTRILPRGVRLLNVNFPVPYEDIEGVDVTSLGDRGTLDLPLFDPSQGFPSLGVPPIGSFPACADATDPGDFCFVSVGVAFPTDPDVVRNSDTNSMLEDRISITPMDADMTSRRSSFVRTRNQLRRLEP